MQPGSLASAASHSGLGKSRLNRWLEKTQRGSVAERVLVLVSSLVIGFSLLQLLLFSFGRDQSIYAQVADGLVQGRLPYRDVWDFKTPGIYFVYALAQVLFGKSMLAPRLLEAIGLCVMCGAMCWLGRALLGSVVAGLCGAALAALSHVQLEFWHTGQPETFAGFLTVIALLLTVLTPPRLGQRLFVWSAIGIALGFAFLLKPPLGGAAIVVASYLARREAFRAGLRSALVPVLVVGLGALLPLMACALWFWQRGGWDALSWTLFEFTPGYTALGWQDRSPFGLFSFAVRSALIKFSLLVPIGLGAVLFLSPLHGREREGAFLFLGVSLVQLSGVALQAKFFPYHFAATLPLLAWVSGIGLYKLWSRLRRFGSVAAVVFVGACAYLVTLRTGVADVPGSFWERSEIRSRYALGIGSITTRAELDRKLYYVADFNLAADRDVAERVNAIPGAKSLFVWGFEPAIYFFSRLSPASRYIYDVPQRVRWERDRSRHELMSELALPPDVIVVQHNDYFPFVTGDELDSARSLATFPELTSLLASHYQRLERVEDFDVYVLRTLSPTVDRDPPPRDPRN